MPEEYYKGHYLISTDPARLDRARDLWKWMMSVIMNHPKLQGLRRWSLVTTYSQELYKKFGFTPLKHPERQMEIVKSDTYNKHS
ncbi:MAG: hypothetical protein HYS07_02950 [Chlamydiae bacterium]|nr:hypothetical protein [Chlamydiota bacterium]MBI3276152.1 hypothetical protein [Chlamydiota bacterium]